MNLKIIPSAFFGRENNLSLNSQFIFTIVPSLDLKNVDFSKGCFELLLELFIWVVLTVSSLFNWVEDFELPTLFILFVVVIILFSFCYWYSCFEFKFLIASCWFFNYYISFSDCILFIILKRTSLFSTNFMVLLPGSL
jgi:hypothetical protein